MHWGFIYSCQHGYFAIVKAIIDTGKVNYLDTGLTYACQGKQMDIIELLLEKGANIDKCTIELPLYRFKKYTKQVEESISKCVHKKFGSPMCDQPVQSDSIYCPVHHEYWLTPNKSNGKDECKEDKPTKELTNNICAHVSMNTIKCDQPIQLDSAYCPAHYEYWLSMNKMGITDSQVNTISEKEKEALNGKDEIKYCSHVSLIDSKKCTNKTLTSHDQYCGKHDTNY